MMRVSGTTIYHLFDQITMLGYGFHVAFDRKETGDSRSDRKVDTCKPDGKVAHALLADCQHDSGTSAGTLTTLKVYRAWQSISLTVKLY
jgi:hypothetical protein